MSEHDATRLQSAYEAANRGETGSLFDFVDSEVELRTFFGSFRGRDGLRRWLEESSTLMAGFQVVPEEVVEAGEHLLVCCRVRGRGVESGIEGELAVFQLWTVRAGKGVLMREYTDRSEALEAAGLRE